MVDYVQSHQAAGSLKPIVSHDRLTVIMSDSNHTNDLQHEPSQVTRLADHRTRHSSNLSYESGHLLLFLVQLMNLAAGYLYSRIAKQKYRIF
jgi:hypothetical protein